MTRAALALVLLFSAEMTSSAQQPARDAPITPTFGTASVSGVVINDDANPQPVRRAIVTLTGPELKPSRGAITDDSGRFIISNLPAGRFMLTVTRASFVTSVYGAKRPGRPGTPIAVADGAKVTNISVRIWRGAAIAGVVRDDTGAPIPNLPVTATSARDVPAGGLLTLSNNGATTNDAGEYRIFGLEPGTYVVSVRPTSSSGTPLTSMTEAQVDAALEAIRRRATGNTAGSAPPAAPSEPLRTFAYAPIYFPNTPVLEDATQIALKPGDERLGVDISLQRVATTRVEGVVLRADGSPAGAALELTRGARQGPFNWGQPPRLTASAGPDGRFTIGSVTPGDYRLVAKVSATPPPPPTPGIFRPSTGDGSLWATADITVSGSDVTRVTLTAASSLTLSGRIVFKSSLTPATPAPASLPNVRVTLAPPWLQSLKPNTPIDSLGFSAGAIVQPDNTFRLLGLLPDVYVLKIWGNVAAPWSLRSAMVGDRDLLDSPTDFASVAVGGGPLVITYSDTRSELSGTLQTQSGAAFSDVFVIAYSTEHRFWVSQSRRVQAVRPGVDGRFIFNDLPPGEYFLGAVMDVDQDEWLEPGFLDGLVATSAKVTIGESEKKTQNLKIGG